MSNLDYIKTRREDVDEIPANWVGFVRFIIKNYTRFNVWVYKKTNGKLLKNFPGGFPICIVTMTGRKTGKQREIALIDVPYGEKRILVASQGGLEKNPVWYHNIKANPDIEIMVGGDKRSYIAEQANAEEKKSLWPDLLKVYPDFDEYQARTDRDIPVFICTEKK